jgi:hypothetical protein
MIYLLILFCTTVVWLSRGHYNPSVPFLVLVFLYWVYATVFGSKINDRFKSRVESGFYSAFLWIASTMIAIKANLLYVSEGLRSFYLAYRFIPLGVTALSLKKEKYIEWIVAIAMLSFFLIALYLSPDPYIDVFRSNDLAVYFFRNGVNPYSQTYPDIYSGNYDYHPGFLYWPGALYLQTFSKILFGDIRVILVIAWWASPFLFPENSKVNQLKKIWWLIPFLAFGFEQAWLDPLLSAGAAITLFTFKTRRWLMMGLAIAIAASIKQYGFIIGVFPVLALLLDRDFKSAGKMAVSAALWFSLALLPFVLWNFEDFISMTVRVHAEAHPRLDALNFTAFWMKVTGTDFPGFTQFICAILGFLFAVYHVWKNRKCGVPVIAESWAIAFGFSIMFGKFAFCNYYWLLISFLLLSLAFADDDKFRI